MFEFLYSQFERLPELQPVDLTGKVVVITGGNAGLGYEASLALAKMRPQKLIIASRNADRLNAAVDQIKKLTGFEDVEGWVMDLASFASIKAFVERFKKSGLPLHYFFSNAGVSPAKWAVTEDGNETTFQVNHLGNQLLLLLLLPTLRKTATPASPGRIVVVASEVHAWAKFELRDADNLVTAHNDEARFDLNDRYHVSKLFNLFMVRSFVDRLSKSGNPADRNIQIHTMNPGLCHSELARDAGTWVFSLMKLVLARPAEQGARTIVYAGISDEAKVDDKDAKKVNGRYFSNMRAVDPSPLATSPEGGAFAEKLWKNTMEVLVKTAPEVQSVLQQK